MPQLRFVVLFWDPEIGFKFVFVFFSITTSIVMNILKRVSWRNCTFFPGIYTCVFTFVKSKGICMFHFTRQYNLLSQSDDGTRWHVHQEDMRGPVPTHTSPPTLHILVGVKEYVTVILIYISWIANEAEQVLMFLSTTWILIIWGNAFCSSAYQTIHQPQVLPGRMGNRTHQKALEARSLCVMDPVADAAVSQLTAARLAAVCGFGI